MNPARSFGPALASGEWKDFWVYLVGPILGATVGALSYQIVRGGSAGLPAEARWNAGLRGEDGDRVIERGIAADAEERRGAPAG